MPSPASSAGKRGTAATHLALLLGSLTAFAPFSTDMYLSSFPDIARHFGCGLDRVQFSLSTFIAGLALGQLLYGPIIDRYGRRRPLLLGIAVFTLSSGALVFAPGISTFIGLRLLQALGGCAGMIISRAIIRDVFAEREAAHALSLMMMVQGVGPIAAPILGSTLLLVAGWQAIFVFLTALGLACLVFTARGLAESLPPGGRHRQNLRQVGTGFAELFTRRAFIVPTLAGSFTLGGLFAFISGSPFIFMSRFGLSQQGYAWLFGLNALGMTAASQLNRMLLRRHAPRTILIAALGTSLAAATALLAVSGSLHPAILLAPLFLCIAMVPLVGANSVAIAMRDCGELAGSASSVIGALQFGLAGVISALVGILHNGTAYPMSGIILACSLLAFGIQRGYGMVETTPDAECARRR
ncbi:multidrug effflux MFS transporter [Paludibacterium yongneupense]|uniref:multidrug effflux MFS transporter n=1 Tax=Paludibacterium yongneupense TaxID=400061 RepID=UPI000412FA9E|nr:multidrug effflux MFS transporter [Paludibacterium yongneupense]